MTAPSSASAVIGDAPSKVRVLSSPILWMVAFAYACNFMDRSIVATLAQAIKLDLLLTDAQLGLLQGLAFVILYSVVGLPIARLAERLNRVNILAICLIAWSAMTMACGLTANFVQLLLCRVGVGIGEAGCNPCSHSIIADAFRPKERSRALSVYMLGATFGTMVGAMSAGVIADKLGWRMAFVIVGIPGMLLAVVIKLFGKDPVRTTTPQTIQHFDSTKLTAVAKRLTTTPAIIHTVLGFTLASFATGSLGAFTQPYFVRAFGLSYGQLGLIFGLSGGLASAASLIITGRMTDWATSKSPLWHGWLPVVGILLSAPCSIAAYTAPSWPVALVFTFFASFFLYWFIIPTLSALHKMAGERSVATVMALVLMFQNLVGLGAGPFVAGAVIDAVGHHLFASTHLGYFRLVCPGGAAQIGANVAVAHACRSTLTLATRIGLLLTVVIEVWASAHYVLSTRTLTRELSGPPGSRT